MRALSCFVMVLSYSRAMYARFVLDTSMETLPRGKPAIALRCHQEGFESFSGTPRRVLYDNLKTAVLDRVSDVIRFPARETNNAAIRVSWILLATTTSSHCLVPSREATRRVAWSAPFATCAGRFSRRAAIEI